MRIAQVSTLASPVTQEASGAVEQMVWALDRELARLGHEVTVFACGGSRVSGELVATIHGPYGVPGSPNDWHSCEWLNLCQAIRQSERFDLIHSHSYLWGVPLDPLSRAPMVHTTHVMPYPDTLPLLEMTPNALRTAISDYQWSAFPPVWRPKDVIHHGVDPDSFAFQPHPEGDYLCYLGRFVPGKSPIAAIKVARALDTRLLMAGPWSDYYRREVEPLVDGRLVEYVGMVSRDERNELLRNATVLLYPAHEPEPFGLVLVEAMMCGTPVAALAGGAASEIVDEAVTGFLAPAFPDLSGQVLRAMTLDRGLVRQRAEARFTAGRMARDYAQLYERVVRDRTTGGEWAAR